MKVLLSIKPQFAYKIFEGDKRFEYRKSIFKQSGISKVIVYASAPISKVIGEFEIEKIICDEISSLWDKTFEFAGIDEDYFLKYFEGKDIGYAIKIKKTKLYDISLCIKEHYDMIAPQSYAYINKNKKSQNNASPPMPLKSGTA